MSYLRRKVREFQKCIGRFLYETGTEFDVVKSDSFRLMLGLGCGKTANKIPNCDDLKGWILRDLLKEMQLYVRDIKNSWESTGCSILLDGWDDSRGRNIVNILVTCPKGTVYIRSADFSKFHSDNDAMLVFFEEVLADVGVNNVVQIISHSVSPRMARIRQQLMDKYNTFFWTISALLCVELVLEKLGRIGFVQDIFKKTKTITRFVHGDASVLRLLRVQTSVRDLVKPSKIRSTIPFLTLQNMVFEKDNLQELFLSSTWKSSNWASTAKGKTVAQLVSDLSFWAGAIIVLKATSPLMRVLSSIISNDDESQLGYVYETMDETKDEIRRELKDSESIYMPFWEVIDTIWNGYLHSPLHAAGYFLNPNLFYRNDFYIDSEVTIGLLCCIVRLGGDQSTQLEITEQIYQYQKANGAFAIGSANLQSNVSPVTWWLEYGKEYPELQRFAVKILSQTCCCASKYKLKKSMAEKLLSARRNQIEQQMLIDSAFVHYNLHLQNFTSSCLTDEISIHEMDQIEDWTHDNAQLMVSQADEPVGMDLDCEDPINTAFVEKQNGIGARVSSSSRKKMDVVWASVWKG